MQHPDFATSDASSVDSTRLQTAIAPFDENGVLIIITAITTIEDAITEEYGSYDDGDGNVLVVDDNLRRYIKPHLFGYCSHDDEYEATVKGVDFFVMLVRNTTSKHDFAIHS